PHRTATRNPGRAGTRHTRLPQPPTQPASIATPMRDPAQTVQHSPSGSSTTTGLTTATPNNPNRAGNPQLTTRTTCCRCSTSRPGGTADDLEIVATDQGKRGSRHSTDLPAIPTCSQPYTAICGRCVDNAAATVPMCGDNNANS